MKDLRVSMKMALGFGLVLAITCALGLMAVTRMGAAEENARRMKDENVPEVVVAGKLERHSLLTMYAMRGYASSGDGKLFTEATGELAQVKKNLEDARLLGEKYPHLAKLRQGVAAAQARVAEYENLAGQTKSLLEQQAKVRADRLAVGAAILKKADVFLASQNDKLKEEIASEAPNARLLERQGKIQGMSKVLEGVTGIRIKALSGDASDDVATYESALPLFAGIDSAITAMRPQVTSKDDIEALEGILKDLPVYKGLVEKQIAITRSVLELGAKRNQAGRDVLEAARSVAEGGMGQVSELADESEEKLDASANILQAGLGFAIVLGAAIAVFITRAISGPVAKGVEFAKTVAAGDYGRTLDIDQKDEIGQLAVSLNAMVQSLKEKIAEANAKSEEAAIQARNANEAMGEAEKSRLATDEAMARMLRVAAELQQVAEVLTSASEELSAQVEQSSRGAENQAQRVSETATAMEEMNSTVLEVAKNAAMAADTATGARTKAEEGARVVGQVVKAIKDVEDQALALKKDMSSLGSQAEGIGQIMNVISDIADQTNLLALNAAIEAARAGEAGRGFAVVADEVRKLAEKTMAATKEVGDSIAGIQQGTRANIENVERTVGTIEEVTSLSVRSGQSLAEIVSMVESATDQVRSIATASEEQSSASEEINRSIEEVATISSETSQAMSEAAQAVSQLARQAVVLKGLVDDMQQGSDAPGPVRMVPAGGRAVLSLS